MAFFSTIFVVFFSIMASQNLSTGSIDEPEKPIIVTPTPKPNEQAVVPNDDPEEEEGFYLTNKQKYFESIVHPDSTNVLLLGTEPGFNFDTIMILNIDKTSKSCRLAKRLIDFI